MYVFDQDGRYDAMYHVISLHTATHVAMKLSAINQCCANVVSVGSILFVSESHAAINLDVSSSKSLQLWDKKGYLAAGRSVTNSRYEMS